MYIKHYSMGKATLPFLPIVQKKITTGIWVSNASDLAK